jgi:Fis family transcriptional regulator
MTIAVNNMQNTLDTLSVTNQPLREHVKSAITQYFHQLDGQAVVDLYEFVLKEVEAPLLEVVMAYTAGNQSKAAILLGINRSTLRKKLSQYDIVSA